MVQMGRDQQPFSSSLASVFTGNTMQAANWGKQLNGPAQQQPVNHNNDHQGR